MPVPPGQALNDNTVFMRLSAKTNQIFIFKTKIIIEFMILDLSHHNTHHILMRTNSMLLRYQL